MTDTVKLSKGEKTAQRILDAAEPLFARHGFEGTSLRQITRSAGITEPGLYNHFSSKQELYAAVLERALKPMSTAMDEHLAQTSGLRVYTELPGLMTDILLQHPPIAALFQQALQGERESVGNQLMQQWLDRLVVQGGHSIEAMVGSTIEDRANLAIHVIAMFNLTTGYFLSQNLFAALAEGDILAAENIERQKRFLSKLFRAMLIVYE
ncbi:MAG: TetR/AcrR family transcriptional regulator [Lysobacterales bacterium]